MTTDDETRSGEPSVPLDTVLPGQGKGQGLASSYAVTMAGSVAIVVLNLFTGVVSARLLSPDGRGAVGAIAGWVMVASVMSGLGFREGMSWVGSRQPERSATVLSVSIVAIFVTSTLGIVVAQFLIPIGFAAQTDEVIRYGQIFMVWILPYSACFAFTNLLGARQRFGAVNAMRVGQPAIYATGLLALWITGRAEVSTVLIAQVVSFTVPALAATFSMYRETGFGRVDLVTAKEGAHYGLRAFGSTLGFLANSRLDLIVLPAVVVSDQIGLYVVAVSAGSMLVGLFGSLRVVVFPAAARTGGAAAVVLTQRAVRAVFAASAVSALAIGVFASSLIQLLYGDEFAGAVTPLRLLLPGVVCWAAAQIVTSGLKGLGRPGAASAAQFSGAFVTVIGLVVLLPPLGITGAAITSSVSYFVVLAVGLWAFSQASGTRLDETLSPGATLVDLRWAASRFRRVLLNRRTRPGGDRVTD